MDVLVVLYERSAIKNKLLTKAGGVKIKTTK